MITPLLPPKVTPTLRGCQWKTIDTPGLLKGGEVGINRLLARLRHVFRWAIEQGYVNETPFKRGGQTVIKLATRVETPRQRRLVDDEEQRLLAHAGWHLRGLIIAALGTGCRIGELLTLQWRQVRCDPVGQPTLIDLAAEHTKTNEHRSIPIGQRLRAVLELRRMDPQGVPLSSEAYVFGTEAGESELGQSRPHGGRRVGVPESPIFTSTTCGGSLPAG